MRNRFDQLAKELALGALGPYGRAEAQLALNAETQFADLRFEPAPGRERELRPLGLLGMLTAGPCLLEMYSQPPGAAAFRACVAKHLTYGQESAREARTRGDDTERAATAHVTWIISAGRPTQLLSKLALRTHTREHGDAGIYRLRGDLHAMGVRMGVVVASELPVDRSTLLVRLMGGGNGVAAAARELATLPGDAIERRVAEPVLLHFQHVLELDTTRTLEPEEQEFIMVMQKSWSDARAEGREEGREEGRAETLRKQLTLRFGAVPAELDQRIREASPAELDRFLERVLFADSIAAVFA